MKPDTLGGAEAMVEKSEPRSLAPEILTRVDEALDHVLDTLFAEDPRGFESVSERLQFYFTQHKRSRKRRTQPQPCMFPGCALLSIKRSHALPRSGPLSLIA